MKVNLFEDDNNVIQGEPVDGTVDLNKEFMTKLEATCKKIRSTSYYPEGHSKYLGVNVPKTKLSAWTYDNDKGDYISWDVQLLHATTLVGEPIPDHDESQTFPNKNMIIPKDIISKCANIFVTMLLKEFPEILEYPKEIVDSISCRFGSMDFHLGTGYLPGYRFYAHDQDLVDKYEKLFPLSEYIQTFKHVNNYYDLDYGFVFAEDFNAKYKAAYDRAATIAKSFKQGTYQGHTYSFKSVDVNIGSEQKGFDKDTKVLLPHFYKTASTYGLRIDGNEVDHSKLYINYQPAPDDIEGHIVKGLMASLRTKLLNLGFYSVN